MIDIKQMMLDVLNEKRAVDGIRKTFYEELRLILDNYKNKDIYVQFITAEKFGIYPQNKYETPTGVYAFLGTDFFTSDDPFKSNDHDFNKKKNINVFTIKESSSSILRVANYSNGINDMKILVDKYGKLISEYKDHFKNDTLCNTSDYSFKSIWRTSRIVAQALRWKAGKDSKDSQNVWAKIIHDDLKYIGVEDILGLIDNGTIKRQAVFFNLLDLYLIDRFRNNVRA